ncbi:hypothetical protein VR010_06160 [Actinomycetaceae bacterium L2_0104]
MSTRPRRPAQLDDEQIEAIEGEADVAYNSELAHTSAQALVPLGRNHAGQDPEAVKRIIALVDDEGVDVLAEVWVRSPEDTLPGILWRGYLLREWIRRDSRGVADRYEAVVELLRAKGEDGELKTSMTPKPGTVLQEWNSVLAGTFEGSLADVLTDSARLTNFLGEVDSVWIESDTDRLATDVTRRDRALLETSAEFRHAAGLAASGMLE